MIHSVMLISEFCIRWGTGNFNQYMYTLYTYDLAVRARTTKEPIANKKDPYCGGQTEYVWRETKSITGEGDRKTQREREGKRD